ncbi:hypothetical protein I79_018580 [Cricetulus griseus]|uniref:Uncharacterized protein n=1 Tax=Cricetulus griseus TaxID=10029 RepID=G3I537_CRIGR|nr:hypothetical protein I79_018580 [Cricetulus griseus]
MLWLIVQITLTHYPELPGRYGRNSRGGSAQSDSGEIAFGRFKPYLYLSMTP